MVGSENQNSFKSCKDSSRKRVMVGNLGRQVLEIILHLKNDGND